MRKSNYLGLAVTAVILLGYANVKAEMVANPDDNTLWIENGKDIKNGAEASSADYWSAGVKLLPNPEGGFIIDSIFDVDKKRVTGRYVKVSPDYPWMTWEITAFEPIKDKYTALFMPVMATIANGAHSAFAGNIPTGIFVTNINELGGVNKEHIDFLNIHAYNSKTNVKYIKLVKKPDYYVEMKSDTATKKQKIELGDNMTFKAYLKEPAEDVSLRFYHAYTLPQLSINGEQSLQLKAEEGSDGKIWSASIPLKSVSGDYKLLKPCDLMIKTIILGGQVKVPVWGINTYPIELGKK